MWEWGEFAISNEMFREGFIEKVRIEEISERGKVRGKDFHSVGRSSIYFTHMLYMDHWIFHYIRMSWWGTSLSYRISKARSSQIVL